MTVPDFQTLMLPLLQLASDGQEHTLSEAIESLAQQYRLSEAHPRELLHVGRIEKKIVLIDGEQLTQLMIGYNVGVAEEQTYTVKKVDLDYFREE